MNDDIKLPERPDPDGYITIKIIGRDVEVNAYRDSTMDAYARANVAHATAALQAERDALARENEAMKRCAIRYLEWLGVTHIPLDQALYDDMRNPGMCGDAALSGKGGE